MFGIRAKSGHSDDRPKILTFSDGFAKSLSHIKSIVFSYPLASPFSDTYSFIIAMLKIRPKICACNALFFAGLRTMTGFRTYPEHTPYRQVLSLGNIPLYIQEMHASWSVCSRTRQDGI
jgi:hypothetical protein